MRDAIVDGIASDGTATDVRVPTVSPRLPATRFTISVVEGVDRGQRFDLDFGRDAPALVGSSRVCALRLGDRAVSRRHASLDVTNDGIRVIDLGSTNGTFVRGLRVREVLVGTGDSVALGATVLRVEPSSDDAAPAALSAWHRFGRMIGASPTMRRLYARCEQFAASELPIVIEGETGTGKELLAETIHETSARGAGPFIVFDCASVPAALLESALFGHERGSFTGATEARVGAFEEAHGGTILLDEIGEIEVSAQPKLLRAIERSSIQRVGSNQWRTVDVRVIAATRRDLDREVTAGRFREDLFYRLAVARIALPPLRDREGDVTLLAQHFWRELGDGSAPPNALLARFESYPWPGNVRELHTAVARYISVGEVESTPAFVAETDPIGRILALDLPFPRARQLAADDFERRYVERVLSRYGGNVARAAKASGIARRYFQILRARSRNEP